MNKPNNNQVNFQKVPDRDAARTKALKRNDESMPEYLGRMLDAVEQQDALISAIQGLPGCESDILAMRTQLSAVLNSFINVCNRRVAAIEEAEMAVQDKIRSKDDLISFLQAELNKIRPQAEQSQELSKRCNNLKAEIDRIEQEKARLASDNETCRENMEVANAEKQKALAESASTLIKLTDSLEREKKLGNKISATEKAHRTEIGSMKESHRSEINTLKEEASNRLAECDSARREAERDLALTKQSKASLEKDLANAEEALGAAQARENKLEAKNDILTAEISALHARELELEREVGGLKLQLSEARTAIPPTPKEEAEGNHA